MIVTKENGTVYLNGLTLAVINFHKDNGFTIADVNRPLKNEDGEYVDDITAEEIEAGYEAVRSFLFREIADPLFFRAQRGEIEESVWLSEIQKIKDENKMAVTKVSVIDLALKNATDVQDFAKIAKKEYLSKVR